MEKTLYLIWKNSLKGQNQKLVKKYFNELVKRYNEPDRYYHNLEHIKYLIDQINSLELITRDRQILIYSAFYHDSIYIVNGSKNEEKSAKLAVSQLSMLKMDPQIIASVERTILATTNHESSNELSQLFLDIDLSILAAKTTTYEKYKRCIRKENSHFITDLYHSRYESAARINLKRELSTF